MISPCLSFMTSLLLNTVNMILLFLRMQWLGFTLTPSSFSLVVQLLFLPTFYESAIPLAHDLGPLYPSPLSLGMAYLVCIHTRDQGKIDNHIIPQSSDCSSGLRVIILWKYSSIIVNLIFFFFPSFYLIEL